MFVCSQGGAPAVNQQHVTGSLRRRSAYAASQERRPDPCFAEEDPPQSIKLIRREGVRRECIARLDRCDRTVKPTIKSLGIAKAPGDPGCFGVPTEITIVVEQESQRPYRTLAVGPGGIFEILSRFLAIFLQQQLSHP